MKILSNDVMQISSFLKKATLTLTLAFALAAGGVQAQEGQKSRGLTPEEIAGAREIFGDKIDYDKVRIVVRAPYPFNIKPGMTTTINNTIFRRNLTVSKGLLAHELGHIYQNQNNLKNTGVLGALDLWLSSPGGYGKYYRYEPDTTKKFTDYNMEQQSQIIEHYVRLKTFFQSTDTSFTAMSEEQKGKAAKLVALETILRTELPVQPFFSPDVAEKLKKTPLPVNPQLQPPNNEKLIRRLTKSKSAKNP